MKQEVFFIDLNQHSKSKTIYIYIYIYIAEKEEGMELLRQKTC
jgi:hypothetical protein